MAVRIDRGCFGGTYWVREADGEADGAFIVYVLGRPPQASYRCTCPAFLWRGACGHVLEVILMEVALASKGE